MSTGTKLSAALSLPLHKFQVQGVRFVEQAEGKAIIADDMGLGKSVQAMGFAAIHPEARPVIIVVPAPIKYGWLRQIKKHVKRETNFRAEILEGQTPYRPQKNIVIINYEIMQYWADYLLRLKPKMIIIDECHYIKNKSAKRTKAVIKVGKKCKYALALSGTPITNAPAEFYPVFQIIAPHLFSSFWEFAFRYCNPRKGFRGGWDFSGSSNLKELRKKISPFTIRRLKKDVLKELPQKRRIVIPVEITNRKEYVRAKEDFVEWLESKEGRKAVQRAKGAIALVRLGKLKILSAEGKIKAAVQWIQDFLEETKEKLVVFAIHKQILEALHTKFPKAAFVSGKTPSKRRYKEVDKFRQNIACRLFFGQLKVAGTGMDGLQVASKTLTLELPWNEATLNQAEDRVLRIGQEAQSVENYYLIGRNTIEEWLLEVIHAKQVNIDKVLEGGKETGRMSLFKMMEKIK